MSVITRKRDYSLIGLDTEAAIAKGLTTATWYRTEIPRRTLKQLMQRRDGPAIRDTLLWFALLAVFGAGGWAFWGTWWAVPFLICYGALYGSASDSRWHECSHGTAFKTRWMNVALYHLASFMIFREPTIWRWSHTRHHTDTMIVGRDPEVHATRPPNLLVLLLNVFAIKNTVDTLRNMVTHAFGNMSEAEHSFVPEMERAKVYRAARITLLIHASIVALAIYVGSFIPLMLVGVLPTMYGAWLGVYVGFTQHLCLAEDVLDHRLNSRTVYMNPIFRFTYWNMNYHVEHHMFPMVPYHSLPALHEIMKPDTPKPYRSTVEAYGEIIPGLIRQLRAPEWFVERDLPASARVFSPVLNGTGAVDSSRAV